MAPTKRDASCTRSVPKTWVLFEYTPIDRVSDQVNSSRLGCLNMFQNLTPVFLLLAINDPCADHGKRRESVRGLVSGHLGSAKVYQEAKIVMPRSLAWQSSLCKLAIVWGRGGSSGASYLVIRAQIGTGGLIQCIEMFISVLIT